MEEPHTPWDRLELGPCAGAFFSTAGDDPSILLRMKEDYDGAEPAASSIAVSNLARLAALARPEEAERLRKCVSCASVLHTTSPELCSLC